MNPSSELMLNPHSNRARPLQAVVVVQLCQTSEACVRVEKSQSQYHHMYEGQGKPIGCRCGTEPGRGRG